VNSEASGRASGGLKAVGGGGPVRSTPPKRRGRRPGSPYGELFLCCPAASSTGA